MDKLAKPQEGAFHLAQEPLLLAMETAGIASWEFTLATEKIVYSPNFPDVFGFSRSQVYDRKALLELIHPDDRESRVKPALERALKTGVYSYEIRTRNKEGKINWLKFAGRLLYDKNGNPEKIVGIVSNITDQKTASEKTELLAAIVRSSHDAIVSNHLDGTITTWNTAAERIFGYQANEIIGKSVLTLFPSDRVQEEEKILAQITKGELIEHFETIRRRKDGVNIHVSLSLSPLRDENNRIVGVSKIARDITRQKIADQKLAESEQRLQMVMQASGIGTWEMNLKTNELNLSQTYLDIIGYTNAEGLTAEILRKHVHPDDLAVRNAAFKKAEKTGGLDYQCRLYRVNGNLCWLDVKGKAIKEDNGELIKILGTIRDITEEKEHVELLQESEQKFRLLADSMPQFVWTNDALGNIDYINKSVLEYSGATESAIRESGWMHLIHPHDLDISNRLWQQSLKSGEPFLCEHRFRRADGQYRWQLSRAVPQYDEQGDIQRWVGTSTDVHEQKAFAEELERSVAERTLELKNAVDALTLINKELEQFAYVSSHDLQEPLRKIQTFANLLQLQINHDDKKASLYLEKISNSAHRMSELIKDLLQYSGLLKSKEKTEAVDLNKILANVIDDYEVTIKEKNDRIIVENHLPVFRAVALQMNQLFYNLIGNALKFCERTPEIRINYSKIKADNTDMNLKQGSEYHLISITDNGIGFPSQYTDRIFVIFQRLNTRDKFEGTGIGLAICKKIVEHHGGYINARSKENVGSVFEVYLPAE